MRKQTVVTTLDKLPYGPEDAGVQYATLTKPKIPDGVSRKMLRKDILLLTWPSLLESILSQLTSFVDQIMVGRIPGELGVVALASVGIANQPKFLLMTAIQALNVGATAVIARCRGQQNDDKANRVFRHALILNIILSAILMIVGLFGAEWMVRFMGTSNISEETIRTATQYLCIQLYGLIPLCLTFTITATLRGIGDTRTPMLYNTMANVINVVLNYILIYGKFGIPAMGVAGASLATVIGQTVAFGIACGAVLRKRAYLYFNVREKFAFDRAILMNIIRVGFPAMVEQLLMRAGFIIFGRTVAGLGDLKFATHEILTSINSFSFMVGQAFAAAATTLMGQSIGKRRYDMAIIYNKHTRMLGRIASVFLVVLCIVFRGDIVGLFTTDASVTAMGSEIMFLIALLQPIQTDQFILTGSLRGAGDTRFTAFAMLITILGVRSMMALLLVNVCGLGLWGAWLTVLTDQLVRSGMVIYRFRNGAWKRIKLQ